MITMKGNKMGELRNKLLKAIGEINDPDDMNYATEQAEDWLNDLWHEISSIVDNFSIDSIDDLNKASDAFSELEELRDKLH